MNRLAVRACLARALIALFLLLPAWAGALTSDRAQPIRIRADRVEIDERAGTSIYHGNVVLEQGTTLLKSDRLKVFTVEGELQRAEAEGKPAHLKQRPDDSEVDVHGEALHITYNAAEGVAVLEGEGHVWKGQDDFRGKRIVYDIAGNKIKAEGGEERVQAIFYPKNGKNAPADEAKK